MSEVRAVLLDLYDTLVYIDLPAVGKVVKPGETFGEVESVKAVSDLYAPVAGEVVCVLHEPAADDFVLFDGGEFSPGAGEIELHGKWSTFNVWNDPMGLSIVDAGAGSALKFSNAGIYQGFKIAPPKVGGVLRPFKIEGMDIWMQMQQGAASTQQVTFGMRITFPGEQQNQGGDPSTTWMYDASKQDAGISNVATVPKTCTLVSLKTPASWDAASEVADRFIFETKSNLSASDGILIRRIVLKGVQFED